MNVLVVEDTPMLAKLFFLVLDKEPDMQVSVRSERFRETKDEVPWEEIDAAVVDRYLDGYDGTELLRYLKEEHPRIRRVMLTADDTIQVAEAHAEVLLRKPTAIADLADSIRGVQ